MKKYFILLLVASITLCGCNSKKKKYDPYKKRENTTAITRGFDIPFSINGNTRVVMVTLNDVLGINALFDTGCSNMLISEMEFTKLLLENTIIETDIGERPATIANGETSIYKTVKLKVTLTDNNGKKHDANVEATVVPNFYAECLVGNGVFSQLSSKITLNDQKNVIHFD
ncbi:MAG: retroviral-like aspartic protease family protein [Bacteroidales bacterium]|nr:retroviral-like aspartic protease family protein [Bacteroidales bacterium]